jgi:hypothetical protein
MSVFKRHNERLKGLPRGHSFKLKASIFAICFCAAPLDIPCLAASSASVICELISIYDKTHIALSGSISVDLFIITDLFTTGKFGKIPLISIAFFCQMARFKALLI